MRPGKVTTIRVNPLDCLSVLDVCKSAGIEIPGGSFAQHVSLALSSLLQTVRDAGIIPTRDGFEYNEMMERFGDKNTARKTAIADVVHRAGSSIHISGLSKPASPVHLTPLPDAQVRQVPITEQRVPLETKQAATRLKELMEKKELSDTQGSGVLWSASDEQEFGECYRVVYPDG